MASETIPRPREILLIEDNPGDVRLIQEAFKEVKLPTHIHVAGDGIEALEFLQSDENPRPDLLLLDLNLPCMDGFEVLQKIKELPDLKALPVVILTTSQNQEDVLRTYQLQASCYINKPNDLPGFIRVVKSLEIFWLTLVTLPT